MLLIGHENGTISVRSCQNLAVGMQLLFFIDSGVCKTKNIKAIASLGGSFFASTGEDGNVVIWQINSQIREKS